MALSTTSVPDLAGLKQKLTLANSSFDISELIAQIMICIAENSKYSADAIGTIVTNTGTSGTLGTVATNTGTSGVFGTIATNTGQTGTLGTIATHGENTVKNLHRIAEKSETMANSLYTASQRGAHGNPVHVAVEHPQEFGPIALSLQTMAPRGEYNNPVHVKIEHPKEINVGLQPGTLDAIKDALTSSHGALDDAARRELLKDLLQLRDAVMESLSTAAQKKTLEDKTKWLVDKQP
jgi:hypothetical protein